MAFNADVAVDDGVIVYLNGVEIIRANMPDGHITSSTTVIHVYSTIYFLCFICLTPLAWDGGTDSRIERGHMNTWADRTRGTDGHIHFKGICRCILFGIIIHSFIHLFVCLLI
jgi:hypothetical protein